MLKYILPLMLLWGSVHAEPVIPVIDDLQATARQAAERQVPLLVMFSASHCGYCVRMEEEYLKPMLRSGDYEDKVLIGKFKIDGFLLLNDFDGEKVHPEEVTRRYGVRATPTLALLDANGQLLGPKMVGLGVADFRWPELDGAIAKAVATVRSSASLR